MGKCTSVMQALQRKFQNGFHKMEQLLATGKKESTSVGKNYKISQKFSEICYPKGVKATSPSFIDRTAIIVTREIRNNRLY